jgi:RHS repeat-associated protein
MTLPSGRLIEHEHDNAGRPTALTYGAASTVLGYTDATNRISSISQQPGAGATAQNLTMSYDGDVLLRTSSSGSATGEFNDTYDANRYLTAVTLVSGSTTLETAIDRDDDGLATAIGPFALQRLGPGASVSTISDAQLQLNYGRDSIARLTSRAQQVSGQHPFAISIDRDAAGRVTRREETLAGTQTIYDYTYDAAGQLVRVVHDGTVVERYAYDLNGNRTARQLGNDAVEPLTYDAQQRLATRGETTYTFDADGFLKTRDDDHFDYSPRGELLEATVGATTVTYAYDGLGRRTSRTVADATTTYLYGDPSAPFRVSAVRDPGGTLTAYYYDQDGSVFAMRRDGTRYYIATDQLGTPRVVINTDGDIVKSMSYDTYGNELSVSDPQFDLPFGFAGGLRDDVTKLTRFGLRDYEPSTGRWTARDPSLLGGGQINLYQYVANDPVSNVDPSGLASINVGGYSGGGGGIRVAWTDAGLSVCGEFGFGKGQSLEVDPVGGLDPPGASLFAEGKVELSSIASGRARVDVKHDPCEGGINVDPKVEGCVVSLCRSSADDHAKAKSDPKKINPLADPNFGKISSPTGKAGGKACGQISW